MSASQAEGRRFESGIPLYVTFGNSDASSRGRLDSSERLFGLLPLLGRPARSSNLVNHRFETRELYVALVDKAAMFIAQQQIVFAGASDDIESTRA